MKSTARESRLGPYSNSVETEATLSLMRRGLVQSLESLDVELFQRKLEALLEGDFADMVLQSGLGLEGKTALHLAVECRFQEALKLLLATDKVNLLAISGETGWTALHTAVHLEDPTAIRILLRYPIETLDAAGSTGDETVEHCCEDRLLRARELLWCHSTNPIGATALHMAVRRNNAECVRVLLEDANWLHSRLAEFRPSEYGASDLEGSCELCYIQDRNGDSALHWAVSNRSHEIARLLCSYGAQIHRPINQKGHEPLTVCKDVLGDDEMTAILTPFRRADPAVDTSGHSVHQPCIVVADSASNQTSSRLRRAGVTTGTSKSLTEGGQRTTADQQADPVSQRRPQEQPMISGEDRGGCDKDESRIEKVFRDLGFLVKLLRNLSSGEMKAQLKHLGTATDHSTYDCFVSVIMAHGGVGEIYGVDGSPFLLHEITAYFTADKCPTLAGKPKLFFIQACRGEEYQLGYAPPSRVSAAEPPQPTPGLPTRATTEAPRDTSSNPFQARSSFVEAVPVDPPSMPADRSTANPDSEAVAREQEPAVLAAKLPRRQRLVPTYADFLISCATKAGFKAQRDPKEGSIYIQSLCRHLEQYGRERSLLDIITGVHREVSERVFVAASSSEAGSGPIFLQTPEVRHTLTRRVQFV
nr:unnamed protein product [Spirometra erinaceieuropaei]